MTQPTCNVLCAIFDDTGAPVAGATVTAKLNQFDLSDGYIVPEPVKGTTDVNGHCTLALWPNQLGATESMYVVKIQSTNGKSLTINATVPNVSSANLWEISELPPYPGLTDGQLILTDAVAAGAVAISKAADAASSAAAAASSAASAASSASGASSSAGTATTEAGIATTQAGIATTQAGISTTQAGIATTEAGIATTKASEAASSASSASTSASTATTKASEALTSANNAASSATTATTKANDANSSATYAASSASAASGSATAAAGSASAAASSASAASGSATTAASQASTATTQAGSAATSATAAASSASTAASQATTATTAASTSTTQAAAAGSSATAAAGSATAAAGSATGAATSATASASSATSSDASASTATAQVALTTTQANLAAGSATTAAAQASLSAGYAASAGSAIQQDISGVTAAALHRSPGTVTGMFIYDTTKDSDGGAWTEKCQHTSWYSEPLNGKWLGACVSATSVAACETIARAISGATTGDYFQASYDGNFYKLNATSGNTKIYRGNKAKFPKLCAIVAESAYVIIYDLTEPGRPMWMRFDKITASWSQGSALIDVGQSCLAAVNGIIAIGNSNSIGVIAPNFPKDLVRIYLGSTSRTFNGNIAQRNATMGANFDSAVPSIVNPVINAVAMTVLPDAPVDPVSGLQVPTIAVATAGGISVIKHDGTVVNSSSTTAFTKIQIDYQEIGAVNSTGYLVSAAPSGLGASFALTSYTVSSIPALMGVPTVMA